MAQHRAEQIYVIQSKAEGRANLRPAEHSKSKSRSRSCRKNKAEVRADLCPAEHSTWQSRTISCIVQQMAEQFFAMSRDKPYR